MSHALLREIRDLIQRDVNRRGLATDPAANLISACPDDFASACRSIAETPNPSVSVVTGFYIAHADPPCGETDGPLGALYLARALTPLGIAVSLETDPFCERALQVGLKACGLGRAAPDVPLTHRIALERVGPSHDGPCYSMRGVDITAAMRPAHLAFKRSRLGPKGPIGHIGLISPMNTPGHVTTIGIGDGGNEIGMGKIPRDVIARNVPNGGLIACRVPTDHLIVAGVSNWGAYALAAGVAFLRGAKLDPSLFDPERERDLLRVMVEQGPLVDGVTGKPTVSVDGLPFDEYVKPLLDIKGLLGC